MTPLSSNPFIFSPASTRTKKRNLDDSFKPITPLMFSLGVYQKKDKAKPLPEKQPSRLPRNYAYSDLSVLDISNLFQKVFKIESKEEDVALFDRDEAPISF